MSRCVECNGGPFEIRTREEVSGRVPAGVEAPHLRHDDLCLLGWGPTCTPGHDDLCLLGWGPHIFAMMIYVVHCRVERCLPFLVLIPLPL